MNYNICFIVPGYPYGTDFSFQFVGELVKALADTGINCTVISPQSITNCAVNRKKPRPRYWIDKTKNLNEIEVYQPWTLSFSNLKLRGYAVSGLISKRSTIKQFKKLQTSFDLLYAHFWGSGLSAGAISNRFGIPFVVATGESVIRIKELYPEKYVNKYLRNLAGVIAVSSKNKEESLGLGLGVGKPYVVIPNSIDLTKFKEMDRRLIRKKLNIPQNLFVITFVGAFIERKGPLRVLEAIQKINYSNTKVMFIGNGPPILGEEVLFSGSLNHSEVAKYLNASDVFVLPTLAEGCPNATVEAMACGLPIISSNLPFNFDILDNQNAILVDPMNVDEIADSIKVLKENPDIRISMGKMSLKKAQELSLEVRAEKVLDFIYETINKN